ncbi:MAG TPA: hypothetical protein VGP26_23050 [Actinophytocola sp.]|jgi:hypothetical protein|nr:hypothetical protein [Actinophytocola sp.]
MRASRPHSLAISVSPEHLVTTLVRNLADAVGGQAVYGVVVRTDRAPRSRFVPIASWPEQAGEPAGEVVREPVAGGGMVCVAAPWRWNDGASEMLRETATWLGVAVRLARLRADHERAHVRAERLRAEVSAARERLAEVRDLERRRLVGAITTTTLRDLADVREQLQDLAGPAGVATMDDLAEARESLDDLLDNFRTIVRGVYPAMLPDRGPRAALEELASMLPRPVRFRGDLGPRVGWQVESGLYHAVAAVLNALAGEQADEPVTVFFLRDDALRVRVTTPVSTVSVRQLRSTLGPDAERLTALGGAMECAASGDLAVVTVRVAERIDQVSTAGPTPSLEHSALYRQVRDLVRQGQRTAAAGPDRARWDAVAERMAARPRLAVVGGPPGELGSAEDAVTIVVAGGPADEALAAEFLADDGPRGAVDGVLCLLWPGEEFRAALRRGRHRVELAGSTSAARLAGKLAAWQPVIAARRAIVTMTDLVRRDHPLRWAVERIGAEAHEIAELDLLDELERSDTRVLRFAGSAGAEAVRLLGGHGADPRVRLGLPEDADEARLRTAAEQVVRQWRARAEHPATGGRDRAACEVLVRSAEGLLTAERTR